MSDTKALYLAAAEQVCRIGELAIETTGRFSLVLSGGTTPRPLYELLAAPPFSSSLDWNKVEFFWGDERVVAPDDKTSNFRMAREAMLDKLKIPAAHIHRIRAEGSDLEAAARSYEEEIERVLGQVAGVGRRPPHFNLFLLGMGPDGHTASIFPGTEALEETERWVIPVDVPSLGVKRITMTPPLINSAHFIIFMVTGGSKADVVADVLQGPRDTRRCPAQLIHPLTGEVIWFADRDASAKLIQHHRIEA
ncbi:MAG TPA: 6-phosphogluconolactonase [Polyangiaceae bacterium]|nr:6-phosphogluconolactonase [Polyangiaceae bacterium]